MEKSSAVETGIGRGAPVGERNWSPEPWPEIPISHHIRVKPKNYARARQCVNACATIDHPEKIPAFVEAAKALLDSLNNKADLPVMAAEQDFFAALKALGVQPCA